MGDRGEFRVLGHDLLSAAVQKVGKETASSAETAHPSPRRIRHGSSAPFCLLSPPQTLTLVCGGGPGIGDSNFPSLWNPTSGEGSRQMQERLTTEQSAAKRQRKEAQNASSTVRQAVRFRDRVGERIEYGQAQRAREGREPWFPVASLVTFSANGESNPCPEARNKPQCPHIAPSSSPSGHLPPRWGKAWGRTAAGRAGRARAASNGGCTCQQTVVHCKLIVGL